MAGCATVFTVGEDVGITVSKFPIADGGHCDIDAKGYASRQDAYQGRSNPTLTGLESGAKMPANTRLSVDDSRSKGVFHL